MEENIWTHTFTGRPTSKGNSGRIVGRARRPRLLPSAAAVRSQARLRAQARLAWIGEPLACAVSATIVFVFAIPRSGPNKNRKFGEPCMLKVDSGNLLKCLEDSLKGVVYLDDSQVVEHHMKRKWGVEDGTVVVLEW